jgi:bacillopeptidase F
MNPQGSRLRRNVENQTRRQIITYLVIIGAILFAFIFFGGSIIGGIGDLIFNIKGNHNQVEQIKSKVHIDPPILDAIPQGTDKETIDISGSTSIKDGTVELYVNDSVYKSIGIGSDGKFKKSDVKLHTGNNTIKALVRQGENSSDFSDEEDITYSKDAPNLDISSPTDNQTFTKADQEINVTGKTNSGDITVTVNGFRAIVKDDGSFSYYLKLNEGDNTVKISATNSAGKNTDKELHVKYQP